MDKISRKIFLCFLALVLYKLWLVEIQPLLAVDSPHDDLHFVRQAISIIKGDWLGEYNQYTLMKGVVYPLFIAGTYTMSIPLLTAQHLLYAVSCLVFVIAINPFVQRKAWLVLIFAFFLFNPATFAYFGAAQVLRLGIYPALSLLVISCALGLYSRLILEKGRVYPWAIGLGISIAAFWHTREEGIWILPSLVLIILFSLISTRKKGIPRFKKLLRLTLIPIAIWGLSTVLLSAINWSYYGIFTTLEIKTPEFKSAYGGLLRIKTANWMRFYPVLREARQIAYDVSPTFSELKPYIEGEKGRSWERKAGEIPAAHFVWVFRDAVQWAGYYSDAQSALEFYGNMGDEINSACEIGKIDCRNTITSLMPPWTSEYNDLVMPSLSDVFEQLLTYAHFSPDIYQGLSRGSAHKMFEFEVITSEKIRTSKIGYDDRIPAYQRERIKSKLGKLEYIWHLYQDITPFLFLLSLILLTITVVIQGVKMKLSFLSIYGLSVLGGNLAIIAILTLIVITSYSEIVRPMNTAYPLLLAFIVSSFIVASSQIKAFWKPNSTETASNSN